MDPSTVICFFLYIQRVYLMYTVTNRLFIIGGLYTCTLVRLKASDIDQEIKERAISCMGQIICNLGDYLEKELHICLPIFMDRLRNEITRQTTVKALTKIAASPLKVDLPIMVRICYVLELRIRSL